MSSEKMKTFGFYKPNSKEEAMDFQLVEQEKPNRQDAIFWSK